ncbi:polyprenyl synthetase family protein [Telmatocola sphagniphila]|uniref:Polyprenyl synthetase family protein n=1 Tax=Telmatocola sphagniphila TaxID=1123043 RepID=A0A8E6B8Q5_9BACT|nr:polyprenyl synthetase family protein [Telmatocola sphagniphila]QVL33437.1 polyprenyl synthetase family protein [Telmatocola sphagniphila]
MTIQPPTEASPNGRKQDFLNALLSDDLLRVETHLEQFLSPHRKKFPDLVEHLAIYKGKRLRPALTLLSAHALQLGVLPHHHLAAAIIELIHTATLIHDDVLDEADVRRKTLTMHQRWGNKSSILLGDLLFSMAYHQASKTGDAKIGEMIGEATTRVCVGEIQQSLGSQGWELTETEYYSIIDGKTAALTECACRLAGQISRAKPEITEQLALYGRELGIAFQISDDLLDIVGDQRSTGKTLGTDLIQKKATLPILRFLQEASQSEKTLFESNLDNRMVIVELFRKVGALEQVRHVVDMHIQRAKRHLQVLPNSTFRSALEKIAEWCSVREC